MTTRDHPRRIPAALQRAAGVLGVAVDGDEAHVRAAYVRRVAEHPPDADPDGFEQVREAYDLLRDPSQRASLLFIDDPNAPLTSLIDESPLRFVGPGPWIAAVRQGIRACHESD